MNVNKGCHKCKSMIGYPDWECKHPSNTKRYKDFLDRTTTEYYQSMNTLNRNCLCKNFIFDEQDAKEEKIFLIIGNVFLAAIVIGFITVCIVF